MTPAELGPLFAVAADERLKKAGQRQAESAVPYATRQHIKTVAEIIVRSGQPFTFTAIDEATAIWEHGRPAAPLRCVYAELSAGAREILDQHKGAIGSLATEWSGNRVIRCVGKAKRAARVSRRFVHIWIKHPDYRDEPMGATHL